MHRDLKSGNVLVSERGELVVVDFGIARLVRDPEDDGEAAGRAARTMTVTSPAIEGAGTIGAISPERARGDEVVGTQEDVWAIGVLLFEMATGGPPQLVAGLPALEALRRIGERPPPPVRTVARAVGRDLATVIDRCVAFEPGDRYPDAAAVRDELERVRRGEAPRARPLGVLARGTRAVRRNPVPSLVAIGLAIGLLAATAGFARLAGLAEDARRREVERRGAVLDAGNVLLEDLETITTPLAGVLPVRTQMLEAVIRYVRTAVPDRAELSADEALKLATALSALGGAYARVSADVDDRNPALAVLDEASDLLAHALDRGGGTPEAIARAGRALFAASWQTTLLDERQVRLREVLMPAVADRLNGIEPPLVDAELVRLRLLMLEANGRRFVDDQEGAIRLFREAAADLARLAERSPGDPEIMSAWATAEGAHVQNIAWLREAGGSMPVLDAARRHHAVAKKAAEVDPSVEAAARAISSEILLARALAMERPGDVPEILARLESSVVEAAALADRNPGSWRPRREAAVCAEWALRTLVELAERETDPERRATLVSEARRHHDRGVVLLRARELRDELRTASDRDSPAKWARLRERLETLEAAPER